MSMPQIRLTHLHRAMFAATIMVLTMSAGLQVMAQSPAQQQPSAATAAAAAGNIENGQHLFTKYYCYSCHGSDGQGGAGVALIGPNLPAFSVFRIYLRKPAGSMPPYRSSAVSDTELVAIYAYLKSVPAPAPANSIPLLNQ